MSETVEAVVRERRFLELAVARRRPRDHWRRIRYFLDQARAWDDAGQATLRGFIEWAKEQAEERARVAESVAPEPDDDAVRILTIHGSKGLEFPVVVLAGLSTQPPNFSPAVVWGTDGQPELRVGRAGQRAETPGYDAANAMEKRHDDAERLRLLYVAMTRARDHLVVSMHHKDGSKCHAASIAASVATSDAQPLEPGEPSLADAFAPSEVALAPEPATYLAWAQARSDALARAARPTTVAATTLATLGEPDVLDPGLDKDAPGEQVPTWRRGRAGTAIGRAVHAVLQTVDLAGGAGLAETARAQAFAEGVADRADEVRALAESAMAAAVVRDAVEGGHRWWREVPVAAEIDGIVLEGFIDLLVEHDDGLVVVDYKTDQMPDAALDAAVSRYAVQGAAYAVALEATLGRPVVRCVFVFARTTGAVERDIVDLEAATADVRSRIATLTELTQKRSAPKRASSGTSRPSTLAATSLALYGPRSRPFAPCPVATNPRSTPGIGPRIGASSEETGRRPTLTSTNVASARPGASCVTSENSPCIPAVVGRASNPASGSTVPPTATWPSGHVTM